MEIEINNEQFNIFINNLIQVILPQIVYSFNQNASIKKQEARQREGECRRHHDLLMMSMIFKLTEKLYGTEALDYKICYASKVALIWEIPVVRAKVSYTSGRESLVVVVIFLDCKVTVVEVD